MRLKQITTGPSRSRIGLARQRIDASERAAFRKAGFRRTQPGGNRIRFNSTNDKNQYSRTAISSYPSQSAYAKDMLPPKDEGQKVKSTKDRVLFLRRLQRQLKTTRTPRGVHNVDILPKGGFKKNESKNLISRGREYHRVVRQIPSEIKNAGGRRGDKIVGKAVEVMPGSTDVKKGRENRRALYSRTLGATKSDPITKVQVSTVKEQMKTFSEFFSIAEKYYEPHEKLPSGKTPIQKAIEKNSKSKHLDSVLHGADNSNYKLHSDSEVHVNGDKHYMKVHHPDSGVTFNVSRHEGPGQIHTIHWSHHHDVNELSKSQKMKILHSAKHVWKNHVEPRLPYGAVLYGEPSKSDGKNSNSRANIYSKFGMGKLTSYGMQSAKVGREKSPKQKAKGNTSRLKGI